MNDNTQPTEEERFREWLALYRTQREEDRKSQKIIETQLQKTSAMLLRLGEKVPQLMPIFHNALDALNDVKKRGHTQQRIHEVLYQKAEELLTE